MRNFLFNASDRGRRDEANDALLFPNAAASPAGGGEEVPDAGGPPISSVTSREQERAYFSELFGGAAAPSTLAVAVVRSPLWTGDEAEDLWQVEVPRGATMRDVKAQIEELYGLPEAAQRLQRVAEQSGAAIDDSETVEALLSSCNLIHLLPAVDEAVDEEEELDFRLFHAAEEEQRQAERAMVESLRGVQYGLRVVRPESCGGRAAGRSVTLRVDALARAGDVQEAAEVALLGAKGAEPAWLHFRGRPLPAQAPLHLLGISDGDSVFLSDMLPEPLSSDDEEGGDDFDGCVRRWAAS